MTFFKIVFILFLLYLGFRIITKPFRDALKDFRSQMQQMNEMKSKPNKETKSRSENIGEYIDYEEID